MMATHIARRQCRLIRLVWGSCSGHPRLSDCLHRLNRRSAQHQTAFALQTCSGVQKAQRRTDASKPQVIQLAPDLQQSHAGVHRGHHRGHRRGHRDDAGPDLPQIFLHYRHVGCQRRQMFAISHRAIAPHLLVRKVATRFL